MANRLGRIPWAAALYVAALQMGARYLESEESPSADAVLRRNSTNVENLRAGKVHTLVTSAFLVEEPMTSAQAGVVLGILGGAEALWGRRRTLGAFTVGHVGASALVFAGLMAGGAREPTASAVDVGMSYGCNGVIGTVAQSLPGRRLRGLATGVVVAGGVRPLLRGQRTFTDVGHLTALLLGLGTGALLRRGDARNTSSRRRAGSNHGRREETT